MPTSRPSLPAATLKAIQTPLKRAQIKGARTALLPEVPNRQPVHTVYGGAHLFRHDTARKLGDLALRALETYAPDAGALTRAVGVRSEEGGLHRTVYARVVEKLRREPVEDLRVDFEDGYGHRPDAEEDGHAESTAEAMARGMREKTLPPFMGIRIKALTSESFARSVRTLDLFISALARHSGGKLPENFVVTLPKVSRVEEVTAASALLGALEKRHRLGAGGIGLELMVETPQALVGAEGRLSLRSVVAAGKGRVVAAHLGAYDYTAALDVTAAHQTLRHPACDLARQLMQLSLAGTGVLLSDGATNVLPVGPHKASPGTTLSREELERNREVVSAAWHTAAINIRHALESGIYQGWDLHPAQLPIRYATTYTFFLEALAPASARLRGFMEQAAQATLLGDVFDDAASGQGLLNFFLRGLACGALTPDDVRDCGLTAEELRTRSFVQILEARRAAGERAGPATSRRARR